MSDDSSLPPVYQGDAGDVVRLFDEPGTLMWFLGPASWPPKGCACGMVFDVSKFPAELGALFCTSCGVVVTARGQRFKPVEPSGEA